MSASIDGNWGDEEHRHEVLTSDDPRPRRVRQAQIDVDGYEHRYDSSTGQWS